MAGSWRGLKEAAEGQLRLPLEFRTQERRFIMPNFIRTDSENNRTTGFGKPGLANGAPAPPQFHVHDGDTLAIQPSGNMGVRLLGIDTPEISFMFPGTGRFTDLSDERWNSFLRDPLSARWGEFSRPLPRRLQASIQARASQTAAGDHYRHAVAARDGLQEMIREDMRQMDQTPETFGYYMGFGFEVMDGYGRLLCTVNRNQPNRNRPGPRPPTYNQRLLTEGLAVPYFIWPNVNPWDRPATVMEAVIAPGQASAMAQANQEIRTVRTAMGEARAAHRGIFNADSPLSFEPFELRFLSRRSLPSRYLLDLTSDSRSLIHPLDYSTISNPEDRLWIPREYVPLFQSAGWTAPSRPST